MTFGGEVGGAIASIAGGDVPDTIYNAASETAEVSGYFIHSPLILMLVIGLLGGYLSWVSSIYEKSDSGKPICRKRLWKHLITGILATFMVPLFLQMIGSSLLEDVSPRHSQYYVFLGLCSAAAYVAQRFAGTISERLIKDAANKAEHAEQEVDKLKISQLKLQGNIHFLEREYPKALIYLREYLELCPNDINTLCRVAYSLKRLGQVQEALNTINKAIKVSEEEDWLLYYNRACYTSLIHKQKNVASVVDDLKRAYQVAKSATAEIHNALKDDMKEDFKDISKEAEFETFLNEIGFDGKETD